MILKSFSLVAATAACLLTFGYSFEAKGVEITDHLFFDGSLTVLESGNKISLISATVLDYDATTGSFGERLNTELTAAPNFLWPVEGSLVGSGLTFGTYWLELGKVTSASWEHDVNGASFFFDAEARLYSNDTQKLLSSGTWVFSTQTINDSSSSWSANYDASTVPDAGASVTLLGIGLVSLVLIRKAQWCA